MRSKVWYGGLILALGAALCGGCSDDNEYGSLHFTVRNDGSPAQPEIFIPQETAQLQLELFQEPAVTGKTITFSDSALQEEESDSNSETSGKEAQAKSLGQLAAERTWDNFAFGHDKEEEITRTYYRARVDYTGGEPSLEIGDIQQGEWILRVSALDQGGQTLAYYQDGININGGSLELDGWLQSGRAPEGYLYATHTANGTLTRISLYSNIIEQSTLSAGHPAYLFAKRTQTPKFSDPFYATTGGTSLLQLTPDFKANRLDVEELGFVRNGTYVRSAANVDTALISFFSEGLVRFFDFSEVSNYDYLYTGQGASYLSQLTGDDCVWVCNENSNDLSLVDLRERSLALEGNLRLGSDSPKAAEANAANTKIWVLAQRSGGGAVRVIDFSQKDLGGETWAEFTTDLAQPSAIYLESDQWACVADNQRQEAIFLDAANLDEGQRLEELFGESGARLALPQGGDQILSDGDRLYVLQSQAGQVATIDIATRTLGQTYKLGGKARHLLKVQ